MNELDQLTKITLLKIKELCETYQYEVAESFCHQLLKVTNNDEAWFLLGISCAHQGKISEALSAFDKSIELTEIPQNREYALKLRNQVGKLTL